LAHNTEEIKKQEAGLARQIARQQRAQGSLRKPSLAKGGTKVFSGLSNINKRQRAEINSAGQQITRIRKKIIGTHT